MKLDALIAADAEFTTGNNNLITAAGLKVAVLGEAKWKLVDNGADSNALSMYCSARNMPVFFNDNDFKNWEMNSNRPLMKGSVGYFYGVDIRVLSSASASNTSPGGATTPTDYLVEYESVAVAYNRRPFCTVATESWKIEYQY